MEIKKLPEVGSCGWCSIKVTLVKKTLSKLFFVFFFCSTFNVKFQFDIWVLLKKDSMISSIRFIMDFV